MKRKLDYVDALRGLAILGVLVVHCGKSGSAGLYMGSFLQSMVYGGAKGVQLFFVMSAFTLFMSFDSRIKKEKYPVANFYIRRFFRIAPMYYIGIIYFAFLYSSVIQFGSSASLFITPMKTMILTNLSFIHGFSPNWIDSLVPGGWSIADEMCFYAFLPLLFFSVKNANRAVYLVLISLVIRVLFNSILNYLHGNSILDNDTDKMWSQFIYFYLPNQLPVFSVGIFLYYTVKENYSINSAPFRKVIGILIIAGIVDLFFSLTPYHILFVLCFLLLGYFLSRHSFKLIVNPFFINIGKVSFSMYLVHFAILMWLTKMHIIDFIPVTGQFSAILNFTIRYVVLLGISFVVSFIFYHLVEMPMQEVGKRIIKSFIEQKAKVVADVNLISLNKTSPVISQEPVNDHSEIIR